MSLFLNKKVLLQRDRNENRYLVSKQENFFIYAPRHPPQCPLFHYMHFPCNGIQSPSHWEIKQLIL